MNGSDRIEKLVAGLLVFVALPLMVFITARDIGRPVVTTCGANYRMVGTLAVG
jgi:hypothetical protein